MQIKNNSGQFIKGHKTWNMGKKGHPNAGFKKGHGKFRTKESYKKGAIKISKAMKGKPFSVEHKKKLSSVRLSLDKNILFSEKVRKNMSRGQIKRRDRDGRKVYKIYRHIRDKKYLQWVSDIFQRDNWTCQTCGIRGVYLEVHHIKSWAKYPKFRFKLNNGVTLCLGCHKLTNNYKNRKELNADS